MLAQLAMRDFCQLAATVLRCKTGSAHRPLPDRLHDRRNGLFLRNGAGIERDAPGACPCVK